MLGYDVPLKLNKKRDQKRKQIITTNPVLELLEHQKLQVKLNLRKMLTYSLIELI